MPELDKKFKHTIEVVVDRLVMQADLRHAARRSRSRPRPGSPRGSWRSISSTTGEQLLFSENFACPDHGVSLPELQPRIFSFNAPHGACPRCTGLGSQQEIDPDLLVPDPSLSIDDGALVPWSVGGSSGFYEAVIQAIADRYEIDTRQAVGRADRGSSRTASCTAPTARRSTSSTATAWGGGAQYMLAFDGIVASLQRRYRETDSSHAARADRGVHVASPVPGLQGRAAEAGGARGHGRRQDRSTSSRSCR